MSLQVKIQNFEGPFDLLLHLIKKNKMDISDVKIYDITNQYLKHLNEMREMDLEVTSEFIVIAATLIEIKSKMLLPKQKEEEEVSATLDVDPRQELINKLIEYRKFKLISQYFKEKEHLTGRIFTKKPEIIEESKVKTTSNPMDLFKNTTILDLYNIYNDLINKYESKMNTENVIQREMHIDTYRIEDKMDELKEKILLSKRIFFSNIINQCSNKSEVVVTFLALLELIKLKDIKVMQQNNFSEIYIEGIKGNER